MFKGLFGEVGSVLKFLAWGLFFSMCFMYACTKREVASIQESNVGVDQINMSAPSFNTKDYGSMVDVTADTNLTVQHKIQDFKATLHLYDCPDAGSSLAACKEIGNEYELFDGVIEAGTSQDFNRMFH